MKNRIIISISLFVVIACGKTDKIDTSAVSKAIKQREIKKISDVDITDKALSLGKKDEQSFITTCLSENDSSLIPAGLKECLTLTDSSRIKNVEIYFDTTNVSNELEKSLVNAYFFDFKRGQQLYSNIQDLKNNEMLYSFPVYKKDGVYSLQKNENSSLRIVFIYMRKSEIVRRIE
jgi:hypothetical protein